MTGAEILEDSTVTGPERANRLRAVVLPALAELTSTAEQVRTGVPAIDAAHSHLLAALRAKHSEYVAEADYARTGDPHAQAQAFSDRMAALSASRSWRASLAILDMD
jgi:hypothetical protein